MLPFYSKKTEIYGGKVKNTVQYALGWRGEAGSLLQEVYSIFCAYWNVRFVILKTSRLKVEQGLVTTEEVPVH